MNIFYQKKKKFGCGISALFKEYDKYSQNSLI